MNTEKKTMQTYGVWAVDVISMIASYLIATQIRFGTHNDYGNKTLHYMVLLIMLLFGTLYNYFADRSRGFLRRGDFVELVEVVQYNGVVILFSMAFVFFAQWSYILSRSVILNFVWMNVILMYVLHLLFKRLLRRMLAGELSVSKVLVVAPQECAEDVMMSLHHSLDVSYQVVGYVSLEESGDEDSVRAITERMTQIPFDEVFIYAPILPTASLAELVRGFEEMGVTCHYSLNLPDVGNTDREVNNFGNYTVVSYSRFRSSYKRLAIKRVVDIIGGIVGLLLTAIITIFLAPAIKIDSPGPVFFSQTRVGKNGRRFKIYKFRSMYIDAEERKKELEAQNEVKGLMFKMKNDPRVTRVGAFIRKTSLDEFPQFWNVLKGDMSLVGTRPPTEGEFEQYNEHYRRRLSMTPGLTGMWQVSGRSNITDFDEIVRLDLQYIDNWSLTLDCKILLQTVGVVLFHKGAK